MLGRNWSRDTSAFCNKEEFQLGILGHIFQRHLVVGGGGQVEVPQEPPELHGRGVVLGQTGEVVVRAGQEFPQLV